MNRIALFVGLLALVQQVNINFIYFNLEKCLVLT